MDDISNQERAVELLQQLGLKEYEARCFVALARLPRGTAKEISEVSEVPRTRVYDAIRVLETKGLVETQHSSPQQFRAVSIEEAARTLRAEYEERTDSLENTLAGLDPVPSDEGEEEVSHEVWALSGGTSIATRTARLIEEADSEVVVVIGEEHVFTDDFADALSRAADRGASVIVGTVDERLRDVITDAVPGAETFVSGLAWLTPPGTEGTNDHTEITHILMVDRGTILVSSRGGDGAEQAVFGRGFENGLVVVIRRLMATGLLPEADPADLA
jgi:sugar-specific transcriptional regulator TrmB